MVLLVGIGQQFINDYYARMDANQNLNDMASMIVAAIVLLVTVHFKSSQSRMYLVTNKRRN